MCFRGASFRQTAAYRLTAAASLVAIDAWTAGRVARGERWAFDELTTSIELSIGGQIVLRDATLLSRAHGPLDVRLAPFAAFATVVLAGPMLSRALVEVRRLVDRCPPERGEALVSESGWPWGSIVRVAARSSEELTELLRALLGESVTLLLGDDPFARRW
jgi:urease accessory protein